MSSVRYLDYEVVVEINAEHGGDGAGVRDESGLRAAVGRAEATFMGEDLYPTVVSKAAALLHALSTTQYFHDGNKRTAWLTTKLFLSLNDFPLRQVPDIEAEMFVLAIATKAFETDEGPEQALRKAREWFESVRFRMTDRLDYAMIARSASSENDAFNARLAQLGGYGVPTFPVNIPVAVIVRTKFRAEDRYRDWKLRVTISAPNGCAEMVAPTQELLDYVTANGNFPGWFDARRDTVPFAESVMLAFDDLQNRHDSGVIPALTVLDMVLHVRCSGRVQFIFEMNGEFLARRILEIGSAPELVEVKDVDGALAELLAEG